MQIVNITDKNILNEFVIRANGSFLESWEWGEFQEKIREKIWRLGVREDGKLVAVATIIKKKLPFRKSYFYSPRGPIIGITNYELRITNFLFEEIRKIAGEENVIFLRFEPPAIIHNSLFIIQKTIAVQPSKTLILDLTKTEDKLIKVMHEKTRYNIRLAEKKGVKIIEAGEERLEDFWNLLDQTSGRDKFRPHGRNYYRAMLDIEGDFNNPPIPPGEGGVNPLSPPLQGGLVKDATLLSRQSLSPRGLCHSGCPAAESPSGDSAETKKGGLIGDAPLVKGGVGGFIKLFFAEYQSKLIAAGIFSFFGDTATYLHGGSANECRNVMAPYLLQWHVIKLAKSLGFRYYDFYGIDENKWPGVTRFKKGFGGAEVKYPGTFDLVFERGRYSIYRILRKIRRSI